MGSEPSRAGRSRSRKPEAGSGVRGREASPTGGATTPGISPAWQAPTWEQALLANSSPTNAWLERQAGIYGGGCLGTGPSPPFLGNLCTNRWRLWLVGLCAIETPGRRRAGCPSRTGTIRQESRVARPLGARRVPHRDVRHEQECGQTRKPRQGGPPRAHLQVTDAIHGIRPSGQPCGCSNPLPADLCSSCKGRRPFTASCALQLDPWRTRRGTIDSCRGSLESFLSSRIFGGVYPGSRIRRGAPGGGTGIGPTATREA